MTSCYSHVNDSIIIIPYYMNNATNKEGFLIAIWSFLNNTFKWYLNCFTVGSSCCVFSRAPTFQNIWKHRGLPAKASVIDKRSNGSCLVNRWRFFPLDTFQWPASKFFTASQNMFCEVTATFIFDRQDLIVHPWAKWMFVAVWQSQTWLRWERNILCEICWIRWKRDVLCCKN